MRSKSKAKFDLKWLIAVGVIMTLAFVVAVAILTPLVVYAMDFWLAVCR